MTGSQPLPRRRHEQRQLLVVMSRVDVVNVAQPTMGRIGDLCGQSPTPSSPSADMARGLEADIKFSDKCRHGGNRIVGQDIAI